MKILSIQTKLTAITAILVTIGFSIMVMISLHCMNAKVTDTMISQFVNENIQIAEQVSILLENGGGTEELQAFVEKTTSSDQYLAYAVIIDTTVTAVAHSDTEKIGKSYLDDAGYTVPAAQKGEIMTSKFWADIQKAWTYDIMCPIYVNGDLYGSMDVGIYNSTVDNAIADIRKIQLIVSIITIIAICVFITLFCYSQLHPLYKLMEICDIMGTGDFSAEINKKLLKKKDEVGKIANSINNMKQNLANLIMAVEMHAGQLLDISNVLNDSAENAQKESDTMVQKSDTAADGTKQQTDLTYSNTQMTEEIAKDMEEIARDIISINKASIDTAQDATHGANQLNDVENQMQKIESNVSHISKQIQELVKMSEGIQNVVRLIADIASQTNLLSLNASIEAARAGEQGKGFAVVANEVGTLAEQSSEATGDISKIIDEIQDCIQRCVRLMQEGNESVNEGMELVEVTKINFSRIIDKINIVSEKISDVSSITEKATDGTNVLYKNIDKFSGIAQLVSDNTLEVCETAKEQKNMMENVTKEVQKLSQISEELKRNLAVFKIA